MKHIFIQGKLPLTLIVLHGTGGNENDLIPLAKKIENDANILSIRGNILENGMPRFFKRTGIGVFDIENLIEETHALKSFIDQSRLTYHFDLKNTIVLGYSNGANILGSLLLHYNDLFKGAVLFHPMVPIRQLKATDLNNMPVLITSGKNDTMVSPNEVNELVTILNACQADIDLYWTEFGHQLTHEEVSYTASWIKKISKC